MNEFNFMILYVDNPPNSARFYASLLQKEPLERSETFALFCLDSGLKIGLWSRHTVEPVATSGGGELALAVESNEVVEAIYHDWKARGYKIARSPIQMDFGFTFVALDPDGHRLRVYKLG